MISRRRLMMRGLVALSTVKFIGTAYAKHQHHNGQQLLANKINTNGKHELHKVGDHTVSIQVSNKKIAGVAVSHRTKGNVAVKKYKSSKKMAQGADPTSVDGTEAQFPVGRLQNCAIRCRIHRLCFF